MNKYSIYFLLGVIFYDLIDYISFRTDAELFILLCKYMHTAAVFISGTTSTEVNKGTLLSRVRLATVRTCKSSIKGVWVEGVVYHLWKYIYSVRKCKSWSWLCVGFQFANESLFFYQSVCAVREVSL